MIHNNTLYALHTFSSLLIIFCSKDDFRAQVKDEDKQMQ